jgi:Zn-dependent metalloprotease
MRDDANGTVVTSAEEATGKVGFIRANGAGADLLPEVAADDPASAAAKADAYLAKYSVAFGASKEQLEREEVASDAQGWTVNYTQTYKGLPVFGSLLRVHVDKQGDLTAVNGYAAPDLSLSTDARKSASAAADRAIAFVRSDPSEGVTGAEARALDLSAASNELMIYRIGSTKGVQGPATLAYVVDVTDGASVRERVFVDGNSGKIVNRYSLIHDALDRELYEESPDPADLVWAEGDPLDADCTLPDAGDCADDLNIDQRNLVLSTGESYWLFKNAFGRDSYDGDGATMKTVNNDPGIQCPNANWNGQTTNYCDGVTSDDVVSHEWSHAYTEYTHGLIYQWQSGALNESYSDIFGETLDLINNREDEDEGDINAKRTGNLCTTEGPRAVQLVINNPQNIRKVCVAGVAAWSALPDTTGITNDIVLAVDPANPDGPSVNDGCSPLTNAAAMAGKVGLVLRGTCPFTQKAENLAEAGATAVVIGNNNGGGPFSPGGTLDPPLAIPVIGIAQADADRVISGLAGGAVNVTVRLSGTAETADSFRWLIGEKSTAFGGAIRDMWAPTCAGDPGKVSDIEYVCGTDDGGGVHSNSGVPNHGYALLVDGGTYNGVTVSGLGLTKAAHIYYRAMTAYQTPVSGFADHADSLAASCADLTNASLKELSTDPNTSTTAFDKIDADDCAQVDRMAQAVELRMEPVQCDFQPLLDPNTPASCGEGTTSSASFEDDFESGLGDWELDGDNPYGGPTRDWKATGDVPEGNQPAGSTQAAFGPTPDLGTCTGDEADFSSANTMTSPEIEVGEAGDIGPKLVFDHNVQTELGYDGGTVSMAVNGGAFETIPAEAYVFNEPSVLATEAAGNTNPLAGEDGFTGTDGGKIVSDWGTSIIDLEAAGAAIGDTIQVRFAIGRDGCGGVVGWYVDNVRVITCVDLATANITAAHVPNPSTFGQSHSVDVEVSGTEGAATGTVTVTAGNTTLGTATLDGSGQASIALDKLLPAGTYDLTATYSGDTAYDTATTSFTGTVQKASASMTAKAIPGKVKKGNSFKAKVKVTGDGFVPTGNVIIKFKGRTIGEGTLSNGKVKIKLDADFRVGKATLKAKYQGSAGVNRAKVTFDLTVLMKK